METENITESNEKLVTLMLKQSTDTVDLFKKINETTEKEIGNKMVALNITCLLLQIYDKKEANEILDISKSLVDSYDNE